MTDIVPAVDRIAHYEASLDGERIPANILDKKALMIQRFSDWANDIVPREIATKAILDSNLIQLRHYPWYQAAMRDMYKGRFHGGSSIIAVLRVKWVAYGLDDDILQLIIDGPVMTDPV